MGVIGDEMRAQLDLLYAGQGLSGYDPSESVTVVRSVQGEYSTTTGTAPMTPTSITARGLVLDYTREELANSGGLIESGDLKIHLKAADVGAIDRNATITCRSAKLRIVTIRPRYIEGALYDYEIQARR